MSRDSKERFSSRVGDYVKYRPGYPREVFGVLEARCGLDRSATVADVGAGTGIFTRLLLDYGCTVFAVEPNRDMLEAAERESAGNPRFRAAAGSAEATTLDDESVDLVVAVQAFHWFDHDAARREFARIARAPRQVALIWNIRSVDATPFMTEYEALIRNFGTDYEKVHHKGVDEGELDAFFGAGRWALDVVPSRQIVDYAGLEGRLRSSSYTPEPGHPSFVPMLEALGRLFDVRNEDGRVSIEYDTKVYTGRLG